MVVDIALCNKNQKQKRIEHSTQCCSEIYTHQHITDISAYSCVYSMHDVSRTTKLLKNIVSKIKQHQFSCTHAHMNTHVYSGRM